MSAQQHYDPTDKTMTMCSTHGIVCTLGGIHCGLCAQAIRQERDNLMAFAVRVGEFHDYTHDDVSELEILYQVQRAAQTLIAQIEGRQS